MDILPKIFQVVVALGIFNVWIIRFGKSTNWRGGGAKNLTEEFATYGLPRWFMVVTGCLKLTFASLLIAALWIPGLAAVAGSGIAVLMFGAVLMHAKVRDPLRKSAPAATMLALSLATALIS
jgi:hypothetical protein